MIHVERKGNEVYVWDYEKRSPIILGHDETIDLANRLLDAAGHMKQEQDEEAHAV